MNKTKEDSMEKYYKPIEKFSPSVDKAIDKLDRKFYLLYSVLCVMVAPFIGYTIQAQEWFDHVISNLF